MSILLTIVGVLFAILQIMLFFKLWGMTNDIREIKNKYLNTEYKKENANLEHFTSSEDVPASKSKYKYKENSTPTGMYILIVIAVILIVGIIISYITK